MLKRALLLMLISTLCVGCLTKKQVIEGNQFQSSVPSMMIKIDAQIPYLGKTESSNFDYGTGDGKFRIAPERYEAFYFVESGRNNLIERFVILVFSRLTESHWFYIDDFGKWFQNPMQYGNTDLGNRSYKSASLISSIKSSDFAKYFNSNSHFPASCYALKVLHRNPNENSRVTIWYGENCERFSQWLIKSSQDDDQKQNMIIKKLDENFKQAIVSLK
jgi:hypothetical protein